MGSTPFDAYNQAFNQNPYGQASQAFNTVGDFAARNTPQVQTPDFLNSFVSRTQSTPASAFQNDFTNGFGSDSYNAYQNSFTQSSGYGNDSYGTDPFAQQNSAFGKVSTVGGAWSALDQHNNEIGAAAAQYGVPANLLKSMINRESSGNWDRDNRVYTGLRNQRMLPFVGIFESTANSWGLDFDSMIGNKGAQIAGMAKILSGLSQQYGGYENAAKVYFGGEAALNGGFKDEYGMDSDTYGGKAIADWKYLDQQSGFTGGYDSRFTGDWGSLISNGALFDWGEFGAESDNGLYGYGTQYGLNGTQHTGVDIAAPRGSQYFAPGSGVVMCAGTGNGQAADGSGCAAFGDTGGGAGRVEVMMDDGSVLIFGHSATSALRPGQRFNAGDVLGTTGTMNSDHSHLEARVRDPSTPSGWRIVDPRTILGGNPTAPQTYAKPSFTNVMQKYLMKLGADS